jgi:hypothetical protein
VRDRQNRTSRVGQAETEQAEQEIENRTGRKGKTNRQGRTGQAEQKRQIGQADLDGQLRTGRTRLPGNDCHDRACQDSISRKGLPG